MSSPSRNEVLRFVVSMRSAVNGTSDPRKVVDRLEVMADAVQRVLWDDTNTTNAYVSLGVTGELGLSSVDGLTAQLRAREDSWEGMCHIRVTVRTRI